LKKAKEIHHRVTEFTEMRKEPEVSIGMGNGELGG
jgi:hypothetical protein